MRPCPTKLLTLSKATEPLLLDTHVLLWALASPKQLSKDARVAIENPSNDVLFSAATSGK